MGEAQLQAVKDYIAKHNLEDELSNAVNHAIKLDSDDPFKVISEYLRKLAKVRRPLAVQTAPHARDSGAARASSLLCHHPLAADRAVVLAAAAAAAAAVCRIRATAATMRRTTMTSSQRARSPCRSSAAAASR